MPLPKLGKPQSAMIQILLTMAKSAAFPLAERTTNDSKVSEIHLSYINQKIIVNSILKNTNLVPIT